MRLSLPRARTAASAIALVLLALALTGCATDMDMASPPPSGSPVATPTAIPSTPDATPAATAPTQTDTEWGRIWDALPGTFPTYPGASPTETGGGPASAFFDVGAEEPAEVVTFFKTELERAGLSTGSLDGPREDGGWEMEASGTFVDTCRVRVTATPMGGTTIVEIMYGADCPFD